MATFLTSALTEQSPGKCEDRERINNCRGFLDEAGQWTSVHRLLAEPFMPANGGKSFVSHCFGDEAADTRRPRFFPRLKQ